MAIGNAIKEFFVSLGLDHEAAEWAEAFEAVEGLNELLEKLVETVEEVAEQLVESVVETGEYAHALEALSARTGQSTTALQEWEFVSKMAGASGEAMTHAWTHMARTLGEVKDGSVEAARAFGQLGVRVRDGHGQLRTQQELFDEVADKLAKMKPGWERNAAVMKIFGRGGTEILPVIAKGAKGIEELKQEAHDLGLVMSEEDVEAAGEFAKGMERIHAVGESLRRDLAMPLIEALNPMLESLTEWLKNNRELIKLKITEWAQKLAHFVEVLGKMIQIAVKAGSFLVENWKILAVLGVALATVLELQAIALGGIEAGYIAAGISAVIAGAEAAAAWLAAAAPVVIMAALLAAIVLVAEDVYTFLKGGDSLIGRIGPAWTKFLDDFTKPHEGDNWFQDMLRSFLRFFMDIDQGWGNLVKDWKKLIGEFVEWVKQKVSEVPGAIKSTLLGNAAGAVAGPAAPLVAGAANLFFGGGASSPTAAAGMAAAAGPQVNAQQSVVIHVQQQPGQSSKELADHLNDRIQEHHDAVMREAAAQIQGG